MHYGSLLEVSSWFPLFFIHVVWITLYSKNKELAVIVYIKEEIKYIHFMQKNIYCIFAVFIHFTVIIFPSNYVILSKGPILDIS